jgi:hypothetical protein
MDQFWQAACNPEKNSGTDLPSVDALSIGVVDRRGWWRAGSLISVNFQMPHLQLSSNLLGASLLKIRPTNNRHLLHF